MYKKYIVELLGTFILSFVVLETLAVGPIATVSVPVAAALTLGLFVYTIGTISGAHINPAVTIGIFTLNKITVKDTFGYILAQICGAVLALAAAHYFYVALPVPASDTFSIRFFMAEALGTMIFTFGIGAVVLGKVKSMMSGIVVGGSLLLGILVASMAGSDGILNPAVAFALNSVTVTYMLAPIVGSLMGFQLQQYLSKK